MHWLVTGANGFLGANAVRVLSRDHRATAAVRPGRSAPTGDTDLVSIDFDDAEALTREILRINPDVILHCAGMANHQECALHEDEAMHANATVARSLASAARAASAVFVYVSTDAVFSGARGWYTEGDDVDPNTAYGRSKAAGEVAVREVLPDSIVARTNFFGWSPSGQRSALEFFVRELEAGNRVPGYVNYAVTSLFVEDVVESIELIVESGETGVFHVVARDAVAKADFGRLVADEFGFDVGLIDDVRVDGPDRDLSLRSDRLAALRGSAMPSQAEGVARARTSPRF